MKPTEVKFFPNHILFRPLRLRRTMWVFGARLKQLHGRVWQLLSPLGIPSVERAPSTEEPLQQMID